MPVNFSVRTRSSQIVSDSDGDGVADAGDVIRTTLTFANTGDTAALDVQIEDLLNGLTIVPGSIKIGPMAVDDVATISGNTPQVFTFAQLLGNDIDPDGSNATMTITGVSGAVNGTVTIDAGAQTVTFTPNTGYQGAASFQYSVADAQGLTNVAGFNGTVNVTVSGLVWYVDANYAGANGAPDGSYLKPFTSLTNLNDDGTVGTGRVGTADGIVGDDDIDGANDTIFVYDRGNAAVNGGITLEAGQKLFGDAHTFVVNGISIGVSGNQTTINSHSVNNTNYGVTLSTNNEIRGINLDGDNTGTTNLRDGGGTVGTLTITDSSITGSGQAVDIDQGGALTVTLTTMSSASSTAEGVHLAGTAANLLTGTFTANAGTIQTSTGTGFLVGTAGGGIGSSGGSVNITYNGDISSPGGSLVEVQDRTGGTVTFGGSLTDGTINGGTIGIFADGNAGTINFNGQTFISAGAGTGNGVQLSNNTGTINFNPTGTGLDITTTSGFGLSYSDGGTLNITGSANSINSTTGQLVMISNGSTAGGIQFQTMSASGVVTNTAVSITNLDGAGTFNGGNVTIAGTSVGDGLFIGGGSAANFSFGTVTIGTGAETVAGDGIEINGAGNGTVTITSVDIDATAQSGVEINGSTNTVTINGGTIGAQNDAAGDTVLITGGTGAVTVNANLTNTTAGANLVNVTGHGTGTIAFGGTMSSTGGAGGIDITNNASGTINFTGSAHTLTTGANAAVNITTNGAAINFTGGNLDISTTGGAGFSANATGGSVTVTGNSNTVSTGAGTAVNIQGTDIGAGGVTFNTVNTSGAASGIILANTGVGGFTVVGTTGVNGSGGSILNSTGHGIDLTGTTNVSLTGVTVTGSGGSGINGSNVNGLSLTNVTSSTNGNAVDEGGVFILNASGNVFVTNSTFNANADDNFAIRNDTGSLNFTATGSTFSNSYQGAFGDDNLILQANNTAGITALISGNTFQNAEGDHFQFATNLGASGSSHVTFTNNILSNNQSSAVVLGSGVTISPSGSADLRFLASGNTINDTISGYSFNVNAIDTSGSAQLDITIQNNTIGTSGVVGSGPEQSGAIQGRMTGSGTMNLLIDNNDIFDWGNGSAIDISSAAGATNGSASIMNATITNNLVTGPTSNALRALLVGAGASAGTHNNIIRVTLDNNAFDNTYPGALTNDMRFTVFSNAQIQAPGYVGGGADIAAFPAHMVSLNSPGTGTANAAVGAGVTNGFANTPGGANPTLPSTPNLPPPPMMLAPEPPAPPIPDAGDGKDEHTGDIPPPVDDGDTGGTGDGGKDDHAGELPDDNAHPVIVDDGVLTQAELDYLVDAAIQRWIDAGASAEQVAAMRAATFAVADMTGVQLGMSDGSNILIDNDGGRAGWFLDTTPGADEEYGGTGTRLVATVGAASQGVDLLTVLMHELGHQAGLADHYDIAARDDLMYGYAYEGERRLPADGQAAGAVPGSIGAPVFQLGPTVVGTVPGNNAFTVQYDATVNAPGEDGLVTYHSNDADISWRDVPAGAVMTASTNAELLAVDSLSLGDQIFLDDNGNGIFDAGDSGIAGVSLTLFADTNNNGVYDDGVDEAISFLDDGDGVYEPGTDTPAAAGTPGAITLTVTTDASGLYAFDYLAPGDYIVRVDASNFLSGGALEGLTVVAAATDPDDNVDNDNNGQAFAGYAASRAIRLDLDSEPTAGPGNDTNNTLDIGFFSNIAPVLDLDADDSNSVGTGYAGAYTEGGAAAAISDTDVSITDADSGDDIVSATITITNAEAGDVLTVGTLPATVSVDPASTATNVILIAAPGTSAADFQAAIEAVTFSNTGDNPTDGGTNTSRSINVVVNDGVDDSNVATATIAITGVNDAPVLAVADSTVSGTEDTDLVFNAANGNLISVADADGDTLTVDLTVTNGRLTLADTSGLSGFTGNGTATVQLIGTAAAINAALDGLVYRGGLNYQGADTLSIEADDGVLNDTDSVAITLADDGRINGDSGDNVLTGTPQADTFVVGQGGNDTISALAGNDILYFGGALTADDNVTGGPDVDTIVLQGDYSGGLVLDGSITGIERISMLAGSNTAFGDPGTNLYDYDLTIDDANFAAGLQVRINAAALLAGEDFTFDGSAETDAKFVVYGGRGLDDLTGGDGNDIFFFAEGGRFAAGDVVNGGDGYDGMFLRGNYTIDFTQAGFAGALANLENLTVSGAADERYARGGGTEFDYSITWDGDLLAAGATMTINGATLGSEESLAFNGSDETNGHFRLFGGAGNDVLTGGAGNDLILGGLRGDTLTGGAGNDIFRYDSVADSNSTERDGIQDFNSGDLIDLSRIDANALVGGNQAFNFVGNAAFSNTAGELRFENISLGGPIWLIQGDTNGDGVSDFEVVLVISPPDPITAGDFIL